MVGILKVITFLGVAFLGLLVATLGFVVVLYATSPSALVRDAAKCADANVCTGDYLTPRGTCLYEPLAATTACTSSCYAEGASTACDGHGACVGASTDCLGYCEGPLIWGNEYPLYAENNTYCDSVIPFWPDAISVDWSESQGQTLDILDYDCIGNQCIKVGIALVMRYSPWYHWETKGGAYFDCMDYIDTNQTAVDTSCITATSYVIANDVLSRYGNFLIEGNSSDVNGYDARVCVFRHACGVFSTKVSHTDTWTDSASASGSASATSSPTGPFVPPAHRRRAVENTESSSRSASSSSSMSGDDDTAFYGGSARVAQAVHRLAGKAMERLPAATLASFANKKRAAAAH